MEVIRDLKGFAHRSYPVIALGNFDGVHLGHRAILRAALDRARASSGAAFALTFEPLPAKLLFPERAPQLLVAAEDKLDLLEQCGLDGVIVINFTHELSRLTPREFVREYIAEAIGARAVVVGHSVSFGHKRQGAASTMVELGREFGFDTTVVGPVKIDGVEVSSTRIRERIMRGEVAAAARLLGRRHFLSGRIIHGRERGRGIGVPTANLDCETECVPPDGVYATRVALPDGSYNSISNIGMRPTFAETGRSIEAHIFDFDRDLYGVRIKLELVERIRGERKFDSAQALAQQIASDVRQAREILAASS